jgi:rubredoxin
MAEVPVLDWRCTKCGTADTYQLVKPEPGQQTKPLIDWTQEIPTLDWTCSRCGTATTYQLVKTA